MKIAPIPLVLLFLIAACGDDAPVTDAGPSDTAAIEDAAPECGEDAECDDGLFCTGVETCSEAGVCEAGRAMDCDDSIACTIDRCSEERRECVSAGADEDGDGHTDASCLDATGEPLGDDCDDGDADRYPGNREVCDAAGHDEDCDSGTLGVLDSDGDGFLSSECCNPDGLGGATCGLDCDDARPTTNPSSTEVCDAFDNDCDDTVDEGVSLEGFLDEDRDGYGGATPLTACAATVGFAVDGGDCDDSELTVHPGQAEFCDAVDNDCDELVDEETGPVPWYLDADSDGYGDAGATPEMSCTPLAGHSVLATDCDDTRAAISPLAAEMCDGIDNNCSGAADFLIAQNDTEDDDLDGLADIACGPLGTDCDDRDAQTGPGSLEECDGRDNDCDMNVDEGADGTVWYADLDRDGFGSAESGTVISCLPVSGYRREGGDCDDRSLDRNPAQSEVCNGVDDDCDLLVDDGAPAPLGCMPSGVPGICIAGGCGIGTCGAGFADCDGSVANGCEAVLGSLQHCGGCFDRCTVPQGTALCAEGVCGLENCTDGWGNCDTDASNGCEQYLATENHCGGCDVECLIEDGLACVSGACVRLSCPVGTDDCNGSTTDGCETTLGDVTNCTECGDTCSSTNATPTCGPEGCRLACDSGFEDCNRDPSDGCEVNTNTSNLSCGACGRSCLRPGGASSCASGVCQVDSCVSGRGDCNLNPEDGCETDTATSLDNCGGCGARCDLPGANQMCTSSVCTLVSCDFQFLNCDADDTNGCEVDGNFNPAHCGGCDAPCDPVNGFGFCDTGTCTLGGCDPGFEDCDAVATNGCESMVRSDANNCGGCGIACGFGRTCSAGACEDVVATAATFTSSCLALADGTVQCFGDNLYGQLGDGSITDSRTPRVVEVTPGVPLTGVVGLSAGELHVCARTTTGAFCWGANGVGQLGDGTTVGKTRAVQVLLPASDAVVKVSAGRNHTCALLATGAVYCWGGNDTAQLGNGTATGSFPTPAQVTDGVSAISAIDLSSGSGFTCAVDSTGVPTCWGRNDNGELGIMIIGGPQVFPQSFVGGTIFDRVTHISAGGFHVCAIRDVAGPSLHCWGRNASGQLGSSGANTGVPRAVSAPLSSPSDVASGRMHTCAIGAGDRLYCFGNGTRGQIGNGSTIAVNTTPVDVMVSLTAVSSGPYADHNLAAGPAGRVLFWGENDDEQSGTPDPPTTINTPTIVVGL